MKRFIIANIGSNTEINFLAPHEFAIWGRVLYVSQEDQDASFWTTVFDAGWDDIETEPVAIVTTVYHGITLMSKVESYAELSAIPNSFYFDEPTQVLYVRIYNDTQEWIIPTVYAYGLAVGVIDSSDIDDDDLINSTIGGIAYHPALITGGMGALITLDNFQNNKMVMDDFTITINNGSGVWDNARAAFYKQRVDVLLADVPEDRPVTADDFKMIRTGVVDEIGYGEDQSFTMRAIDPRRSWDRVAPYDVFTAADFEAPTEERALQTIGKVKPLAIGEMIKIPTVPLSADGDTTNARFCVSTVAYGPMVSVSGVWEIVDGQEATRANYTFTPSTGILVINTGYTEGDVVVSGQGLALTRSVYGPEYTPATGYNNTPQQVGYWLATVLGAIPNTGGYFDKQSFINSETINSQCSFYIPIGGEKLIDCVDRITMPANWTMFVEAGKFKAVRVSGDSSSPDRLYPDELAAPPSIEWDASNFATRIQYNYRKSEYNEQARSLFDDSLEAALIPRYRVSVLAEVDSPLASESAAITFKDERYERVAFIPAVLECQMLETPRWNMFDFVIFDYIMDGRRRLPELIYRVIGLDKVGMSATLRQYTDAPELSSSMYNIYRQISGRGN
jgi:hypothetical protein